MLVGNPCRHTLLCEEARTHAGCIGAGCPQRTTRIATYSPFKTAHNHDPTHYGQGGKPHSGGGMPPCAR